MSDRLADLEALLDVLPDAVARRRLGDSLNQASEKLKTSGQQTARLEALLEVADLIDFVGQGDAQHVVDTARRTAADVGEGLSEAQDETTLRESLWAYDREFLPAVAGLDRSVRSRIRTVAQDRYHPLITYGQLLGGIAATSDLGARLTAFGQKAILPQDQVATTDLPTVIRRQKLEYDALQEERTMAIGAGDVGEFLNALAEHRATLALITAEVWEWLRANDALDRFDVQPA